MSRACVSGILICALSWVGSATRARFVPAVMRWPTSTGTCWSTPVIPARTWSASSCECFKAAFGLGLIQFSLRHGHLRLDGLPGEIHALSFDLAAGGEFLGGDL